MISLKSQREIEVVRKGAGIVRSVFEELKRVVKPGISTLELDLIAERIIRKQGAEPAFKNYHGYPANICTSINDEVVHGIPSERKVEDGDIVSIDVGVYCEGFFSDAARTFPIGPVSKEALKLIDVTKESFFRGIQCLKPGAYLGDLSHAIQMYVEKHGYSVVRDFVGHGIGRELHEEPQIPNFGEAGKGPRIEAGMLFAIEPMVNAGTWRVKIRENKWTVVTSDSSLSAHYEDTVAVRENDVEVLT